VRAYVGDPDEFAPAVAAAGTAVEVVGVKLFARSPEEVDSKSFVDTLARARRAGLPVAVHAVEVDAIGATLAALARAPVRAQGSRLSDRIEHCALCPPELASSIARAGIAVVTQPGFLLARGDKYRHDVEAPLWSWLYPLRSLRDAGVTIAAGSDAPVAPPAPRLALLGATRRGEDGKPALAADQSLTDGEALDLLTSAPAALRGEADRAGRLGPGFRADLVVAEGDPRGDGWARLRIRDTLIAGRVAW
jgi:predicted amidohydrolase YtcJ